MGKKLSNGPKIIVYKDKTILYDKAGKSNTFIEGKQSENAKERYKKITSDLKEGFLYHIYNNLNAGTEIDSCKLSEEYQDKLRKITESVTSETGREIIALTIIQLNIKAIAPDQSIRLHKGSSNSSSFSWNEGVSMRSIDYNFVTPFLREENLLKLNKYGAFMTRSLAENYPYSQLYKAEIRGDKQDWELVVDALENNTIDATEALKYTLSLLKNQSKDFKKLADKAHGLAEKVARKGNFSSIKNFILTVVNKSNYKARIFEVAIHSFLQALEKYNYLEGKLSPMTQMRSANKKYGNVGDVEIYNGNMLIESWDAKYGKSYLRDELDELDDKLKKQPDISIAGFITDKDPLIDKEIRQRKEEISIKNNDTSIEILSFDKWIKYEINVLNVTDLNKIGYSWLIFFVDSLGQKRREIAPIDEPTEEWLKEIINLIK